MRIVLDTRPLLDTVPGGVRTYTLGLSNELRVAGHDVVTWTNSWQTTRVPNKILNPLLYGLHWPKVDELVARRHGPQDWFVMPNPNFIALSSRIKLAVVFHDLSFEVNPAWFTPKERLWHRLVRPRELAQRADRIVAVSDWTKRDLVELYGVPEEKVVVVSPLVIPHPNPLLQGERNQMSFLYLGSLSRRKNVLGLLRAFETVARDVPTARLVLAGPDGYGASDVRKAIASSPVRERITLRGVVSEYEKAHLFASATAFVYPSFYEGYGIPVVEAMRAGVPVIVSDRAALPEVANGAGILIDPYDVSTISHAMRAVATDQSLCDRLAAQSRARAATLLTSSTSLRLYVPTFSQ